MFFIIELVLILGILVVLCIGAYYLVTESGWIKAVFNMKCTEDHLNWIFRLNEDIVDSCGFMTGRSIMFMLVILFADIGHYVIRRRVGDLKAN